MFPHTLYVIILSFKARMAHLHHLGSSMRIGHRKQSVRFVVCFNFRVVLSLDFSNLTTTFFESFGQMKVYLVIKFGLETPFQRIKVFRTAVENFINARPREWVGLIGFRATRVEADMGFIEYKIVGEHREAWQNIGRYIYIVFSFTRKVFYDVPLTSLIPKSCVI